MTKVLIQVLGACIFLAIAFCAEPPKDADPLSDELFERTRDRTRHVQAESQRVERQIDREMARLNTNKQTPKAPNAPPNAPKPPPNDKNPLPLELFKRHQATADAVQEDIARVKQYMTSLQSAFKSGRNQELSGSSNAASSPGPSSAPDNSGKQ